MAKQTDPSILKPVLSSGDASRKTKPGSNVTIELTSVESVTYEAELDEGSTGKGSVNTTGNTVTYTPHAPDSTESVTIKIYAKKDDKYSTESLDITVDVIVTTLSVSEQPLVLTKKDTPTKVITVTTNADSIAAESSTEATATVSVSSKNITITPVASGTTNITVKATADGGEEKQVTWELTVNDDGEEEEEEAVVTTLTVTPETLEVNESEQGSFTITTNATGYTFENKNSVIYSAEKYDNKITVTGLRGGSAYLLVKATADGGSEETKQVTVSVLNKEAPETTLTVTPEGPVSLKVGDTQTFETETNSSNQPLIVSDNPSVVSVDSPSKTITAVAKGTANLTFSVKTGLAAVKNVNVVVNVAEKQEQVEEEKVPELTDTEIKTLLTKPDFNYETDIKKIDKKAPVKYISGLSVIQSYINHMSKSKGIVPVERMAAESYNLYYVIVDILEDLYTDEEKFTNTLTLISKIFFNYKDVATSAELLQRGSDLWKELGYTTNDKDVYTHNTLFSLLSTLSDEVNRETLKAKFDFNILFGETKVTLSKSCIAAIKKFYQFT